MFTCTGPGNGFLETFFFDGDFVTTDSERAGDILAVSIGGEIQLNATIHLGHGDLGAGYDCAARVAHQSLQWRQHPFAPTTARPARETTTRKSEQRPREFAGERNGSAWRGSWTLTSRRSQGGSIGTNRKSGLGTMSFRCNITNHYFYFRLVAFVNCDILFRSSGNAVAQVREVGDSQDKR